MCEFRSVLFLIYLALSFVGPLKIQTLSATPLTPSNVSVGSASDVVIALRCTVGGPNVSFVATALPPSWLPPSVPYATIDSTDSGVIRLEAARVTEDLRLECEFNGSVGRSIKEEVRFSQGKLRISVSLYTQAHTHTVSCTQNMWVPMQC